MNMQNREGHTLSPYWSRGGAGRMNMQNRERGGRAEVEQICAGSHRAD